MTHAAALPTDHERKPLQTLADEISELSAHIAAATYRFLILIREFDEREGWEGPGLKSCSHWLNWKCGIGMGAAREKVRVAHALTELPRISDAFRTGRISFSKVRAMTRVATPENEEYLLMIAEHGTASHVERLVQGYRSVKRAEEHKNVSAETSRRLACDSGVVQWLEAADGTTLDVGRRTRSIPPALRRALERRDQGCRFPGCTSKRFVDAHHIRHWADGGETRLDNLVLLCRHHHRLVHEGGYAVRMDSGSEPIFTDQAGEIIPTGPDTRFRGNVFALTTRNRRAGLRIDPRTPVPDWYGESMDDSMAVEGLLQRE